MSEPAKVRLVRCPKCENLLPEVADYSVYTCGGCGAVLRAKHKGVDLDSFSVKSDEEGIGNAVEKLSDRYEKMKVSDKRLMDGSDNSEIDARSSISSSSRGERRRILRERAEKSKTSLLIKEEKHRNRNPDDLEQAEFTEKDSPLPSENENGVWRSGQMENGRVGDRIEMEDFRRAQTIDAEFTRYKKDGPSDELKQAEFTEKDSPLRSENENGVWRSGQMENGRVGDRIEMEDFRRAKIIDAEFTRYKKDGPSDDVLSRSNYGYDTPLRNRNDSDGFSNVGEDRSELLRRLNEIKDQISSGNVIDKGKGKVRPFDPRMGSYVSEDWHSDSPLEIKREPMPYPYADAQFRRPPPKHNQYAEPPPFMRRQEMGGNGFYPLQYGPDHVQGHTDPLRFRRDPREAPVPYHRPPSRMSGPYMDEEMVYMDGMESYPSYASHHHPSCACFECRNKRQAHVLPPFHHTTYLDRYSDVPNGTKFNYHDNFSSFGSQDYGHTSSRPLSLRSHTPNSHMRWQSDVNSEVGGFTRPYPPRAVQLASGRRLCRPVAGGAPFLACCNCFELLLLPKKFLARNENRQKLICGACSAVIVLAVSNKNIVVSVDVERNGAPVNKYEDDHLNQTGTTFSSDDYNDSGYDFHSMDGEIGVRRGENSGKTDNRRSTSAYASSEVEEERGRPIAAMQNSNADEHLMKPKRPPAGSSLQEYFEYSNVHRQANGYGDGNKGHISSKHDAPAPKKAANPPILRKEYSSATEIDLSSGEYCNTGTTYDSGEASREGSNFKGSKAESFFAGFMKRSSKDSSRMNEDVEQEVANVTVNGHLIPNRLVKKAERLAGPISPGNYWYDFRAGFWGVIGGPCRGIIPPFIQEFNYPLPESCAAGNTKVLVNGRELNQKDLSLLASRGLPTEGDRSYIVEISGRVLDEYTGEELISLGKLAPTVEKNKRGFGMTVPNVVA